MVNFFQGIPKELEEAAMVDGAGPWYILLRVVVPLSKPCLLYTSGINMIGNYNMNRPALRIFLGEEPEVPADTELQVR